MPSISIIAPPTMESHQDPVARESGHALAGKAYQESGLYDKFDIARIDEPRLTESTRTGDPVLDVAEVNREVATLVADAIADGSFPVLAGGTCNHLPGVIGGLQTAYGAEARIGLLWLDAHGDFNTPSTTMSGMLGGMPVAVVAGLCHPPIREAAGIRSPLSTDRIVMVDVRNLDPEEERLIRSTDVEIVGFGPNEDVSAIRDAIQRLAERVDLIDLHIDADILDVQFQPNHPTAEPNGPGVDAVVAVIDAAFDTGKVVSFAVVSVNTEGQEGKISFESGSAMLAAGLNHAANRSK